MSRWRRVLEKNWGPTTWTLRLECGHEGFRSAQYTLQELPDQVLCQACRSLIGTPVKNQQGRVGMIAGYNAGLFDVAWLNDGVTRSTLDELREKLELG